VAQLPAIVDEEPPATNSAPAKEATKPPVSSQAVVPPPVNDPPKQPVVSGPQVLTWTVTPGTNITIPAGGSVTLKVTVKNPTGNPAALPSPLSCLGDMCQQTTQTIASGASASQQFTLNAADYTTNGTTLLLGGYYEIYVKVAS
jgi:hypothetical protein